jgi:ABC-type transport system involved in multi-copper enzyme maturation permease subunit
MRNIGTIALNTFRESIRSKVLYTVILFAVLILLASTFFGTVTIGDQVKVIKDFGLFGISLFSVAYVVIAGATLLQKELARKTIHNILSKAVFRSEFVTGKYLGLLLTAVFLALVMSLGLMAYLYFFEKKFDILILYACVYIIFELIIICAASIFFSSIVVTPVLSGIFTFCIFLAGRSSQYLSYFIDHKNVQGFGEYVLKGMHVAIPNLDRLNVVNDVVGTNLSAFSSEKFIWSSVYALSYAAILLIFANIIFNRREFN